LTGYKLTLQIYHAAVNDCLCVEINSGLAAAACCSRMCGLCDQWYAGRSETERGTLPAATDSQCARLCVHVRMVVACNSPSQWPTHGMYCKHNDDNDV